MKPKVDGYKAHCWLATHGTESEKYSGQWVAVGENGILAASFSFKDFVKQVEQLDVFMPLITKIPTDEDALYVLRVVPQ
ncbi:hypothetical protein HY994_06410 [Candidatus Micrarchaeota archaeon]|nr:hypothetical protein [Candidatus Micrarchaeota archaeon]